MVGHGLQRVPRLEEMSLRPGCLGMPERRGREGHPKLESLWAQGTKGEAQGQWSQGFDECAESTCSHLWNRSVNVLTDRQTHCSPLP